MKHVNYEDLGLKIDEIEIKFKDEDRECAEEFFHGEPVAYYLLKHSKFGDPNCRSFGWAPLYIEMCVNDVDDYDADYSYTAKAEDEFDTIVASVNVWMEEVEKKENSVTDILELKGMPYLELFRRCF